MFRYYALVARCSSHALVAAVLVLAPPGALAACTVSVGGLSFGGYDVFSSSHVESTGAIDVSCDVATPYTVSLSAGSGSYSQRAMANGSQVLRYNLYSDAARSLVWGDGSGGSVTVAGSTGTSNQHTVYGRIPAGQNVRQGSYADSMVVTVTY